MSIQLRSLLFSPTWHWSASIGLLLVRVVFGGAFTYHGLIGIFEGPSRWAAIGEGAQLLGYSHSTTGLGLITSTVNAVGGLCLILGFCSRGVSLLLGLEMVFVCCYYSTTGVSSDLFLFALKDVAVFAMLMLTGPGAHSLDQYRETEEELGALNDPTTQFVKPRRWFARRKRAPKESE